MNLKNNIVVTKSLKSEQTHVTINLDEITLSKLNYILNNLKLNHLPGYWTLEEILKKEKMDKNKLIYSKAFATTCFPVLEHIKRQIARYYIFNLIEQKLIKSETNKTELEQLLSSLIDLVSVKLESKNNVLTEEIISKLLISNINSIFNKYSMSKLDEDYIVELESNYDSNIPNKDYIEGAIKYVSNYKINIKFTERQVNKKVYKI